MAKQRKKRTEAFERDAVRLMRSRSERTLALAALWCVGLLQCTSHSAEALGTADHHGSNSGSAVPDAAGGEPHTTSDDVGSGTGGDGGGAAAGAPPEADAGLLPSCDPPRFEWASLEAAVRELTGVQTGALTQHDLAQVTKLQLYGTRDTVGPLSELACLTELRELTLMSLDFTHIRPLSALTELRVLSLGGSKVSDVSVLSQLPALTTLYLISNRIETVANLTLPEPPASPDHCGSPDIDLAGNPLDSASVQHLCDQGWYVLWGLEESDWQTCNSEREVRCPPRFR